jgi:hypothetical protein
VSYGFSFTTRLDGQVIFASHYNALGAAVDSSFTQVETAVNARGLIAGQTWLGNHNFTGPLTAVTPASAVSGNEVPTAAWVLSKVTGTPAENFGGQLYASAQINGGM